MMPVLRKNSQSNDAYLWRRKWFYACADHVRPNTHTQAVQWTTLTYIQSESCIQNKFRTFLNGYLSIQYWLDFWCGLLLFTTFFLFFFLVSIRFFFSLAWFSPIDLCLTELAALISLFRVGDVRMSNPNYICRSNHTEFSFENLGFSSFC